MCEKTLSLILVYLNDIGEVSNYDCPCPIYKTHPEFHCSCTECQSLFFCKCSLNVSLPCVIDVAVQVDSSTFDAEDASSFVTCEDVSPPNKLMTCFSNCRRLASTFVTRQRLIYFALFIGFIIMFFVGKSFSFGNNKQPELQNVETTTGDTITPSISTTPDILEPIVLRIYIDSNVPSTAHVHTTFGQVDTTVLTGSSVDNSSTELPSSEAIQIDIVDPVQ